MSFPVERREGEASPVPGAIPYLDRWCCPRCGTQEDPCCDLVWRACDDCDGEGVFATAIGIGRCPACEGKGGWYGCAGECDEDGEHQEVDQEVEP